MKKSRLLSILLAMIMVLTMSVPAFAASNDGKITVNGAVEGQTYTIYQILELESYDTAKNAYAYKATSDWSAFINSAAIKGVYVSVDSQGYVTWVTGADAAKFAQLAKTYAENKEGIASKSQVAGTETVTFTNLDLGYYLMDSTLGVLCSLDTTNPTVALDEKNSETTITKEVQEDSKVGPEGNDGWGETNDADISQTVKFRAKIEAKPGAENYVMHDKMSAGLTFTGVTAVNVNNIAIAESNYEVKTSPSCEHGCTFHVEFKQSYLDTINAPTNIFVEYTGKLNENAKIALEVNVNDPDDEPGNPNDVALEYGDNNWTEWDQTITYTWDMEVLKYGNGNKNNPLSGAKFVLLNSDKSMVAEFANGKLIGWEEYTENMDLTSYELTTGTDGKIAIAGLDADTYWLKETVAPAGFNKLDTLTEVTITSTADTETKTLTYTKPVAEINNQSGTELPKTGGIGTTILYVLGGLLVVGAAAALIARRRTA